MKFDKYVLLSICILVLINFVRSVPIENHQITQSNINSRQIINSTHEEKVSLEFTEVNKTVINPVTQSITKIEKTKHLSENMYKKIVEPEVMIIIEHTTTLMLKSLIDVPLKECEDNMRRDSSGNCKHVSLL